MEFVLLILLAGVPYYIFLEKSLKKYTFFISAFLIIVGLLFMILFNVNCSQNLFCIFSAILTSLFTTYKALKTTNIYKLVNYFIFINSPVYFLFSFEYFVYFIFSLLVTLVGLYLIGYYYEKNYGSANFFSVGGLALKSPFAGLFLRIYLINLALYPPFPNAVFLFNSMLKDKLDLIWYTVIIVFFFGNFFVAMKILVNTVFGKANENIFYIDLERKEKIFHTVLNIVLLAVGIYGLEEVLK
ncbi:MAG: hypothetical protein GXO22_03860 [Aquificae bacterium]|nr:hypothetical protein [Aquificota bacterium]